MSSARRRWAAPEVAKLAKAAQAESIAPAELPAEEAAPNVRGLLQAEWPRERQSHPAAVEGAPICQVQGAPRRAYRARSTSAYCYCPLRGYHGSHQSRL